METQIWTLIGLLAAALFGSFYYLGSRIDTLGSRIDSLNSRVDGLSARVETQGTEVSRSVYALASKLDQHLRWHAG